MKKLTILLLAAMRDEARPTIKKFGLERKKNFENMPFEIYEGDAYGNQVMLMTSGIDPEFGVDNVGTQAAAVMTAVGIKEFKPDLIVNFGTAGGFKACGAEIGSVYVCDRFRFHDRRIPFPGFKEYGVGDYSSNFEKELTGEFSLGTVTSGNSFVSTESELTEMIELACVRPLVKDMEAAAIAQVCSWSKQPLIAFKTVTDLIDGGGTPHEEFAENLHSASERLWQGLNLLLQILGSV